MKFKFATPHFYLAPIQHPALGKLNPTRAGTGIPALVARAMRAAACLDLAQDPTVGPSPWVLGSKEMPTCNAVPGSSHGPCLHTQVALVASISLFF